MKQTSAPTSLAKAPDGGETSLQEGKVTDDQNTLLPVIKKRKAFQPPTSLAPDRTAAVTGVSKTRVCKSVPPPNANTAPEQAGSSAQYFSVLYTKRAANKVVGCAI